MDVAEKRIIAYLLNKQMAEFTGGVKMGFEAGRPNGFTENLAPDESIPQVETYFNTDEKIKLACNPEFYGTLFFIFKNGLITHFNLIRTYQGRLLEKMLQIPSNPIMQHPKKRVILTAGIRTKTHDAMPKM